MTEPLLTTPGIILTFLVAVSLGFFIGLERERKRVADNSIFAGVRTFPLIALFGAVGGGISRGGTNHRHPVTTRRATSLRRRPQPYYRRARAGAGTGGQQPV